MKLQAGDMVAGKSTQGQQVSGEVIQAYESGDVQVRDGDGSIHQCHGEDVRALTGEDQGTVASEEPAGGQQIPGQVEPEDS